MRPARFFVSLLLLWSCVVLEIKHFTAAPWPPDSWICSVSGKSTHVRAIMFSIRRRLF